MVEFLQLTEFDKHFLKRAIRRIDSFGVFENILNLNEIAKRKKELTFSDQAFDC